MNRGDYATALLLIMGGVTMVAMMIIGLAGSSSAQRPVPFQVGLASWYGEAHRGQMTASGEIFNPDRLTAAHRTLQFGTTVRVKNLTSGKSVVVRITDRGPYVDGRVIDLSEAAAEALGMVEQGTAEVELYYE